MSQTCARRARPNLSEMEDPKHTVKLFPRWLLVIIFFDFLGVGILVPLLPNYFAAKVWSKVHHPMSQPLHGLSSPLLKSATQLLPGTLCVESRGKV